MQPESSQSPEEEAPAMPESKKLERRAALAEIKRLHPGDPAGAREAARLWFEQHPGPPGESAATSAFHLRKLREADPERAAKAEQALRQNEAEGAQAQNASRGALKEWRKRNPNKVKKLAKLYREGAKSPKHRK